MNKFKQIRNIGKVSKMVAEAGKGIDNCPICKQHREAIVKHTLDGHPQINESQQTNGKKETEGIVTL